MSLPTQQLCSCLLRRESSASSVPTCFSLSPHFLAKQEDIRVGLSSGEDIATIIKQNMVTSWRKWWILAQKQNSVHGHWCEMCECRVGSQSSDSLLKDMEIVCTWCHAHRVSMDGINILPPSPLLCSVPSSAGSERPQRPLQSGRRCSLPEQARWMQMWLLIAEYVMVMIVPCSRQDKKKGVLTLLLLRILLQET